MSDTNGGGEPMHRLISPSDPNRELSPHLGEAPGGFAWWYLDHLDESGRGLVMIWSFGLPFLPGYLGGAREGHPERPRSRPSLNLAFYEGGKEQFYLLRELDEHEASWVDRRWTFGDSVIQLCPVEPGRARLEVSVDARMRGVGHLKGTLTVEGAVPRFDPELLGHHDPRHEWSPVVGPARLSGSFELPGLGPSRYSGWAYHDRNGGELPLDALGIRRWTWCRHVSESRTSIYYVLWPADEGVAPTAWMVTLEADGHAERLEGLTVQMERERKAAFGMPYAETLTLFGERGRVATIHNRSVVDDGPFYLRTLVETRASDGTGGAGIGEWLEPDRVDLPWQRPFVRMRIDRGTGSSFWLPFFSGARQQRWRRLAGQLTGGGQR